MQKKSDKFAQRVINGGVGHNLPQEAQKLLQMRSLKSIVILPNFVFQFMF